MTKESNAVRVYRIIYTSGSSPQAHEFSWITPTAMSIIA